MSLNKLLCGMVLGASALSAHASEWGCQVLLCLANPNGPMAVGPCVPPITRLYEALSKEPPDPFPTCDMAVGPLGDRSWAQQGFSYYDLCPAGTTSLPAGEYAVKTGYGAGGGRFAWLGGGWGGVGAGEPVYTGIGEGEGWGGWGGEGYAAAPSQKICVGAKRGEAWASIPTEGGEGGWSYTSVRAGVYDSIAVLDRQASPRIIDVYVSDKIWRRVRW